MSNVLSGQREHTLEVYIKLINTRTAIRVAGSKMMIPLFPIFLNLFEFLT